MAAARVVDRVQHLQRLRRLLLRRVLRQTVGERREPAPKIPLIFWSLCGHRQLKLKGLDHIPFGFITNYQFM